MTQLPAAALGVLGCVSRSLCAAGSFGIESPHVCCSHIGVLAVTNMFDRAPERNPDKSQQSDGFQSPAEIYGLPGESDSLLADMLSFSQRLDRVQHVV